MWNGERHPGGRGRSVQKGKGSIDTPAAFLATEVGKDPKHPSVCSKPICSEAIVLESFQRLGCSRKPSVFSMVSSAYDENKMLLIHRQHRQLR